MRAVVLLCVVACVTSRPAPADTAAALYHPFNGETGYAEWSQRPGSFHVEMVGASDSKDTTLRMLFNRRALDLCHGPYSGRPSIEEDVEDVPGRAALFKGGGVARGGHQRFLGATALGDIVCDGSDGARK